MAEPAASLEQIRDLLGDLPDRIAAALARHQESQKAVYEPQYPGGPPAEEAEQKVPKAASQPRQKKGDSGPRGFLEHFLKELFGQGPRLRMPAARQAKSPPAPKPPKPPKEKRWTGRTQPPPIRDAGAEEKLAGQKFQVADKELGAELEYRSGGEEWKNVLKEVGEKLKAPPKDKPKVAEAIVPPEAGPSVVSPPSAASDTGMPDQGQLIPLLVRLTEAVEELTEGMDELKKALAAKPAGTHHEEPKGAEPARPRSVLENRVPRVR